MAGERAMADSVWEIVAGNAADRAIGAPGRAWLDGPALAALTAGVRAQLNAAGIGRGDRVAIVMPNGPEMAACFLAVASTCAAAPLNPGYKAEEFEFYLSDLKPAALIVMDDEEGAACIAAARLGIPEIGLTPNDGPAGGFRLDMSRVPPSPVVRPGSAQADDVALVLHTSGTTARPKIVPLTNRNLAASAGHIADALALTPADCCLNVMPLFHIHGLIAAVLSSLQAGAAVCCTPGFSAFRFPEWLGDVRPTWYTAVPTMHQAILMRMRDKPDLARGAGLRLIRSSSASLPPQVMTELETVFGSPVIEAYGMTEAAHQMACNPLPPAARKPGSVGRAAGPEIAVMHEAGAILPQGVIGEVVIRGPNVTQGYENNPAANLGGFTDGWFRTGDQGRIDEDGYLFLTGRLKEQINRGGEKISPLEIDVVLLDHPGIAQVVTFGIPHEKLGEEVGAVVVLRNGAALSEQDVRDFAATRLAAYKVPRRVLLMHHLPKGATGKVQRVGLARKLGLVA
jgi:acyl-CoA synthetase (AMP-forming)/AMP-acid ligase II